VKKSAAAIAPACARRNVRQELGRSGAGAMPRGEGVQIYVGAQQDGRLQWVLQSPQADLLDFRTGEKVGSHGAGPTWTDGNGDVLRGTKVASADAPDADAVPWLLLATKRENGGRFAKVTRIQRVDTWGGRAPTTPPAQAGETRQVRYEATYVFLVPRRRIALTALSERRGGDAKCRKCDARGRGSSRWATGQLRPSTCMTVSSEPSGICVSRFQFFSSCWLVHARMGQLAQVVKSGRPGMRCGLADMV
jgi:hypothetical protein